MTDEQCRYCMSLFCLLIKCTPILNTEKQNRTIFHLPLSCSEGSGCNANGLSPGTPAGRKASDHINLNSWPLPVGWLLTDGGELCVWCVKLLSGWPKLTCANHTTDSRDQQGDPRWLQGKIMVGCKSTNKTGVMQCCWFKAAAKGDCPALLDFFS